LQKFAKRASGRLETIIEKQKEIIEQIEKHEGQDWDNKYGSTGLWRKLAGNLYESRLNKCEIDFYLALSSEQPQKNEILQNILQQTDSLIQIHNNAYAQFLKAGTLALLSTSVPSYKSQAKKVFDELMERSDMKQLTAFRISIERMKLSGKIKPNKLEELSKQLAQSKCKNNLQLPLSIEFLQYRLNQFESLHKTLKLFPHTKDFLGSMILSQLSRQITQKDYIQSVSIFVAQLAAQSALKQNVENYKTLFNYLANQKNFQTPLILYTTAMAFEDTCPVKTIKLLIKASNLQLSQKNKELDIEATAQHAARLAYRLYMTPAENNQINSPLVLEAFENYSEIANDNIDEELEYIYALLLKDCGQFAKSKKLLEKIANRPGGNRRNRAKLDLIIETLKEDKLNKEQHTRLIQQLSTLIEDIPPEQNNLLRIEAIKIYCKLLLDSDDKTSAQKVISIINDSQGACDPNLIVLKSAAFLKLEIPDKSADCLIKVAQPKHCRYIDQTMQLLSYVIEKIDSEQVTNQNFTGMAENCKKLAEYCYECLDGQQKRQAALYLAEITLFAVNDEDEKLSEIELLLNNFENTNTRDINLLRCKAGLFTKQKKFKEAAELWNRIGNMRKFDEQTENQRSWKWWRAKYYELECLSKTQDKQKNEIVHTIEVLQNSFTNIPQLWAEKLAELKSQCKEININDSQQKNNP